VGGKFGLRMDLRFLVGETRYLSMFFPSTDAFIAYEKRREAEIENDFQKKCRKGANSPHTRQFGSARRDKLFIFVGVGVFSPA
jgi:hypothetical protein